MTRTKSIAAFVLFFILWGGLSFPIRTLSSRDPRQIWRVIPNSEHKNVIENDGWFHYNYAYTDPITGAVISAVAVLAILSISALFVKDGSHA